MPIRCCEAVQTCRFR